MPAVYHIFSFSIYFLSASGYISNIAEKQKLITTQNYMIWPNATVPFYVNPEHFDHEQSLKILTALSMFAFKTCLKFAPVMALPSSNEHVMVFVNPAGVKRCVFDTQGHSFYEPHLVTLGYDCLKTPHIEMIIMKALGFPFEHNRSNRDRYIDIMLDNVDAGATDMFIKDINQPVELRILPYDVDSVMHFGNREFSKNGHRTIIFKDPNTEQKRIGLTGTDIRKFDVVYGSECLKRDRQEKIDLCQSYPGVARRKRDTEQNDEPKKEDVEKVEIDVSIVTKSLRVNPLITPPQEITEVTKTLKELGIEDQVQKIVENVFKVSETALSNARTKYCKSDDKANVRTQGQGEESTDILGIINLVSDYAKGMVDKAVVNITEFCKDSESMAAYERSRCDWAPYDPRCRGNFHSTNHGQMRYSTKHRPYIRQSTNHGNIYKKDHIYVPLLRATNDTTEPEGEGNKQENVETKDGGETATTEKMKADKGALRFGATGPPKSRKSLRRHRSVIKNDYKETQSLANPSQNFQLQKQPIRHSKDKKYKPKKEEEVIINIQSDEEVGIKPKSRPKTFKSVNHEDLDRTDEIPNAAARYEADMILNKVVKLNNYQQTTPFAPIDINNQKNRFKVKRPQDNDERGKKRHKKMKNIDSIVKLDSEESYREIKHHRDVPDEPKTIAQDNYYSEERYPVKKQTKKQKIIKEREVDEMVEQENYSNEDKYPVNKPKMIAQEDDYNEDRTPVNKQKKRQKKIREKEIALDNDSEDRIVVKKQKRIRENYGSVASGDQEPIKEKRTELAVPQTITLTKQNREFYKDRKWPGGLVRYVLKPGLGYDVNDVRRRIEEVNNILKERTCVRLKEITELESENVEDFLYIDDSPDYVTGRVGGKQNFGSVELLQGGQHRQHTAMMIMAWLGFYFEVSRHDRDKYIRVHMRHVRADKLHHFEKIRSDATLAVPYDYKSATHPAWQFWRQYGRSGISTVATYKETDPDGTLMKALGQNSELLSETDILKINSIYGVRCFLRSRQKGGRSKPKEKQREI